MNLFLRRPGLALAILAGAGLSLIVFCAPESIDFYVFHVRDSFLSLMRPEETGRYLGYRVVEGEPVETAEPLTGYLGQPERKGDEAPPPEDASYPMPPAAVPPNEFTEGWKTEYEDGTTSFVFREDGTAWYRRREPGDSGVVRVLVLEGVEDGLNAWMWLETERDIPGSYIVQQCLRFSGRDNDDWRHSVAMAPGFSEFDLLNRGEMRSLTWVLDIAGLVRVEPLMEFAGQKEFDRATDFLSWDERERGKSSMTMYYTNAGLALAESRGVTPPREREIISGLIVRQNADSTGVAGMYWERTAMVSVHHPADCLHSYVDLGPVEPGARRVVRGKIYVMPGTRRELFDHWKKDFAK